MCLPHRPYSVHDSSQILNIRNSAYKREVAPLRQHYQQQYQNWVCVDGLRSKWWVASKVLEETRVSLRQIETYLERVQAGKKAFWGPSSSIMNSHVFSNSNPIQCVGCVYVCVLAGLCRCVCRHMLVHMCVFVCLRVYVQVHTSYKSPNCASSIDTLAHSIDIDIYFIYCIQ